MRSKISFKFVNVVNIIYNIILYFIFENFYTQYNNKSLITSRYSEP